MFGLCSALHPKSPLPQPVSPVLLKQMCLRLKRVAGVLPVVPEGHCSGHEVPALSGPAAQRPEGRQCALEERCAQP